MISILCPTRNRPLWLLRMWQSALATATGEVEVVFYVDDDDDISLETIEELDGNWSAVIGERICLSECWNEAYLAASGDIFMHAGDDIVFRTKGWDRAVSEVFDRYPDRICFVYGDDGFQHENLGTHGFLSREWVEAVGYFVPPYFSSDYNDLWLHEVAGMIQRRVYLPEVLIEHLHPAAGKAPWDLTHRERLERHQRDDPGALYERLLPERYEDAAKLTAAMDHPHGVGGAEKAAAAPAAD